MIRVSAVCLPCFVLAAIGCTDVQAPITRSAQASGREIETGAPLAKISDSVKVLYSTFGPGLTFSATDGVTIAGSKSGWGPPLGRAVRFLTPPGDYTFAGATVALQHSPGKGPPLFRISLRSDVRPNHGVGAVIEEWLVSVPEDGNAATYTVTPAHSLALSDSSYWLSVEPGNDSTIGTWNSPVGGGYAGVGTMEGSNALEWLGSAEQWPFMNDPQLRWYADFYTNRRGVFQIEVRPRQGHLVHKVSGSGIVPLWTNHLAPITVNARENADGTVEGDVTTPSGTGGTVLLFAVKCVTVEGPQAFITGEYDSMYFMVSLKAAANGSKSGMMTKVYQLSRAPDCPRFFNVYWFADLDHLWYQGTVDVK